MQQSYLNKIKSIKDPTRNKIIGILKSNIIYFYQNSSRAMGTMNKNVIYLDDNLLIDTGSANNDIISKSFYSIRDLTNKHGTRTFYIHDSITGNCQLGSMECAYDLISAYKSNLISDNTLDLLFTHIKNHAKNIILIDINEELLTDAKFLTKHSIGGLNYESTNGSDMSIQLIQIPSEYVDDESSFYDDEEYAEMEGVKCIESINSYYPKSYVPFYNEGLLSGVSFEELYEILTGTHYSKIKVMDLSWKSEITLEEWRAEISKRDNRIKKTSYGK